MKIKLVLVPVIFAMFLSGCIVCSLNPLHSDETICLEEKIEGSWMDDDSCYWKIERYKKVEQYQSIVKGEKDTTKEKIHYKNFYLLTHTDKKGTSSYIVYLIKLDGRFYFDFLPDNDRLEDVINSELMIYHLLPVHTFAKVDINNDSLTISWFDEGWLDEMFKENKIRIAHHKVCERTVLTASTSELQKFVIKFGNDADAFIDNPSILRPE